MYKRNIFLILLIISLIFIVTPLSQSLTCSINTSCTDAIMFYMKNDTGGYNNAHIALANYSSNYPYVLCCDADFPQNSLTNNCSETNSEVFLRSYAQTNSHVQNNINGSYSNDLCIYIPKYLINISYRDSVCGSGETCLLSISNSSNAHVGECSYYSTQVCANVSFTNKLPYVSYINLSPQSPNTTTDLNCSFTIVDDDVGDTLSANVSWYLNGVLQAGYSEQTSVTNNTLDYVILNSSYTEHFQNWSCNVTPFDSYYYGQWNMSNNVTIQNTAPSIPIRFTPNDENHTLVDRNVYFSWNESIDIDNDNITYVINLTNPSAPKYYVNTTNLFYLSDELSTKSEAENDPYSWKMKACDEYGLCSDWTAFWNFSIIDLLWIEIVNNEIDFGNVSLGVSYDTTTGEYSPFEFENYGNVKADLYNITGNDLWVRETLGTKYLQAKSNYNISNEKPYGDLTLEDWFNVSNGDYSSLIVDEFDYHNNKNLSLLDIKIEVPMGETSGNKSTSLTMFWRQS